MRRAPRRRPLAGSVRALGPARVLGGLGLALALAHLVGLLAAFAHAQAAPASPPAAPPSAAGTWAAVIEAPTGRVDLTFHLAQEGERVHGTYDYRGPVLVALRVRVTGMLRGDALTLFEEGGASPVLEARVEGKAFTGVYRGASSRVRLDATRIDRD